nr:unnamed protein product [Digitaria exilis]
MREEAKRECGSHRERCCVAALWWRLWRCFGGGRGGEGSASAGGVAAEGEGARAAVRCGVGGVAEGGDWEVRVRPREVSSGGDGA